MHKNLVLTAAFLIVMASPCFAQTEKAQSSAPPTGEAKSDAASGAIIDIEKAAWDAFKNKKEEGLRKWASKDYVGLYSDGTADLDVEVADMAKWTFEDISFADMKATFPDKDVAILTYQMTIKGTHDGADASGDYRCSSVFVKKDGKWACVLHTEAEAP